MDAVAGRMINDVEERPGVTSKVIKPEESVEILHRALELCPDIKVAGIAGPGDTLATDYALETFRIIKKEFPDILKCMSTNGLLLYERADAVGVPGKSEFGDRIYLKKVASKETFSHG